METIFTVNIGANVELFAVKSFRITTGVEGFIVNLNLEAPHVLKLLIASF